MSLFDIPEAEPTPFPKLRPCDSPPISADPYDAVLAALAVQEDAKRAYYACNSVPEWGRLYQRVVSANAGVVVAVRAWVAARSET